MKYFDMHVQTEGSDLEKIVERAKLLELSGFAATDYFVGMTELDMAQKTIERAREKAKKENGLDIAFGVIVKAETPDQLQSAVKKLRPKVELLLVRGGDYEINRAASEMREVDMICHPELDRKDPGMDHITMKSCADNDVAVEINVREIIESFKKHRLFIMNQMRRNIYLAKKYGTRIVTTSGSNGLWGLRSGRELASIAHLLGMELPAAIATVSAVPERIIEENRKKLSGESYPGVEVER